ncbi:MAG: CbtA family protein, partial [Albidovulum sp.]
MIQRMVTSALFAGCAAGLFAALLHFAFVQEYILLGEKYETGALVHFGGASDAPAPEGHDHSDDGHSEDGA